MNFASILPLVCVLVSLLIAWEDFRTKEVRAIWFALLFLSFLCQAYLIVGAEVLFNAGLNFSLCILQLLGLWLYFKWVRETPLFDVGLGWGDVAMLLAIAPAFSPINYLVFNFASYVVAIFYWSVIKAGNRFIPLAGIQALLLSLLLLSTAASKKYYLPFNDTIWLNLIARYV